MGRISRKWIANSLVAAVTVLAVVVGSGRVVEMIRGDDPFEPIEIQGWRNFATHGYRVGPSSASVWIIVFFDYTCEYCALAEPDLKTLRDRYPEDVAVVYRHLPSNDSIAISAARASECAASLGHFEPFHDTLIARAGRFDAKTRSVWAEEIGAGPDDKEFSQCLADTSVARRLRQDTADAGRLNIAMTPAFLINDMLVQGYPGFDRLHEMVREAADRDRVGNFDSLSRPDGNGSRVGRNVVAAWRLERLWSVGSGPAGFVATSALDRSEVAVGPDGMTYILDDVNMTVYVVSADGELSDSIGRAGEGPGEFQTPLALDIGDDGALNVLDGLAGLLRWRVPEGRFLGGASTAGIWSTTRFQVVPGGFLFTERERLRREGEASISRDHVTRWNAGETQRLASGSEFSRYRLESPPCVWGLTLPMLFHPVLPWDERNGAFVVAHQREYRIRIAFEDRPGTTIRLNVPPRDVTEAMARREQGDGFERRNCFVPTDEAIRGRRYNKYLQAVADVAVSPAGEVWALRGRVADEPRVIDVFTLEGVHLGTLPLGAPFPAAFGPNDQILSLEEDERGINVPVMYRLSRSLD